MSGIPPVIETPLMKMKAAGSEPVWKRFAIAMSASNLLFLPVWSLLLYGSGFGRPRISAINYWAAILDTFAVAVLFFVCMSLSGQKPGSPKLQLLGYIPILSLLFPARYLLLSSHANLFGRAVSLVGVGVAVVLSVCLGALSLYIVWCWWHTVIRGCETGLLLLSLFCVVTFGQVAQKLWRGTSNALRAQPASTVMAPASRSRVLWLLFDEMDERLSYAQRPAALELPELDRLKEAAFYASNAYPPANFTLISVPALTTGRVVLGSTPGQNGDLLLKFADSGSIGGWSSLPTVFSDAREHGLSVGIAGWSIPYCRLFRGDLQQCYWVSFGPQISGNLWDTMRSEAATVLPLEGKADHVREYEGILEHGKQLATDPSLDIVYLHFPIPHDPPIYDRQSRQFSITKWRPDAYLDSLALVDRTVGELRSAMEKARVWDSTTVILMADHSWRRSADFDGRIDRRVPFLVKLVNQKQGYTYATPFNTVITRQLISLLASSPSPSESELAQWLDASARQQPHLASSAIPGASSGTSPID